MNYLERMREKAQERIAAGSATILAFESSCDETAVAIVRDGREILANCVLSQIDQHALYGGVVPEIASRMHVGALDPLTDQALSQAGCTFSEIDAVAVTCGPGLVGALLTGVSYAKALAYALDLPLVPVNHIEGHVSANYLAHPELEPPFCCLVASGGHSHIVLVERYGQYRLLGQTLDDAAGEAFDKVARVLSIPYPGGPLLDQMAEEGDDSRYQFPHPHTPGRYDFSFSGLKTAVINQAHMLRQKGEEIQARDFAASFRRAVVDALVEKERPCRQGGGRCVAGLRGRRRGQRAFAPGTCAQGRGRGAKGVFAAQESVYGQCRHDRFRGVLSADGRGIGGSFAQRTALHSHVLGRKIPKSNV